MDGWTGGRISDDREHCWKGIIYHLLSWQCGWDTDYLFFWMTFLTAAFLIWSFGMIWEYLIHDIASCLSWNFVTNMILDALER